MLVVLVLVVQGLETGLERATKMGQVELARMMGQALENRKVSVCTFAYRSDAF